MAKPKANRPPNGWLKVIALNRYAGCNVGIVCGRVIARSISTNSIPIRADLLKVLATEHLGPTRWERIGQAPKTLLMYRPLDDIRPIKIAGCIDVLASGKQFVAYGTHPDTWTSRIARSRQPSQPSDSQARRIAADQGSQSEGFRGCRLYGLGTAGERHSSTHRADGSSGPAIPSAGSPGRNGQQPVECSYLCGTRTAELSMAARPFDQPHGGGIAKGFTTPDELASRVWARFIEGAICALRAAIAGRDGPIPMHSPRLARPSVADRFYSPPASPRRASSEPSPRMAQTGLLAPAQREMHLAESVAESRRLQ